MKAVKMNKSNRHKIKELYLKAFPKIERKPFWLMILNNKRGKMDVFSLEENNDFIGIAVMAESGKNAVLLYFAIAGDKRNKGYGSKALQMLKKKYEDKCFYLEIESTKKPCDNMEIRLRRKSFYNRNGMNEIGLDVELFGTEMEVLTSGDTLEFDEYIKPYEKNFGRFIRHKIKKIN